MKKLTELMKKYSMERLVWCIIIAAFCWTDVADYHHMRYNKMLVVWIALGAYYVFKLGAFKRGNRLITAICGLIGCAIYRFFVSTYFFAGYIYYNYTFGVMAIILLIQYGIIIRDIIKNRKLPKVSLITGLFLLMMMYMQFSPLIDKRNYLVMFIILLPYVCMNFEEKERQNIFKGMIDGLCLGFIICQGYAFLLRPYFPTENGSRWKFYRNYCTYAGMSYLQFYLGFLLKYLILKKENASKWYAMVCFIIATFALSLMYMTGGRGPLLGAMAATAVLVAWIYRGLPWKTVLVRWFCKCACIGVLSLALFPVAYAGTRYIPTVINDPDLQDSEGNRARSFATKVLYQAFLHNGEWSKRAVKTDEPRDSIKYITFYECVGDTLCRVVPGLSNILYPMIGDEVIETKAARLQYFHEMGYVTSLEALEEIEEYCGIYEQELPDYFKAIAMVEAEQIEEAKQEQEQPGEDIHREFFEEALGEKGIGRGDDQNYGWFGEGEQYSDMQLRMAVHMHTFGKLNLTGHSKFTFRMYYETGNKQYLGNSHNTFLQVGYDYGYPTMILLAAWFILLMVGSLKKGFKQGEPCCLLPAALVIAISVFGWFEAVFASDFSYCVLIMLCAIFWKKND